MQAPSRWLRSHGAQSAFTTLSHAPVAGLQESSVHVSPSSHSSSSQVAFVPEQAAAIATMGSTGSSRKDLIIAEHITIAALAAVLCVALPSLSWLAHRRDDSLMKRQPGLQGQSLSEAWLP